MTRDAAVGAGLLLVATVPIAVVTLLVTDDPADSPWVALPFGAIVVGCGVAGFVTAGRARARPIATAIAAATLAYLVVIAVAVIRWALDVADVTWTGLVTGVVVVLGASAAGATIAGRGRP